ncbi:MAG: Wzz/FepE/Etk N-terminal domain-containing protein [Rubrobacter sp.]
MTSTRPSGPSSGRRYRRSVSGQVEGGAPVRWRGEALTSKEFLYILWGRRWMVLVATVLLVAGAAVYTFSQDPAYTAEARILISSESGSPAQAELETFLKNASGVIASDDELLSEAVLRSGWQQGLPAFREGLNPEYYTQSNNVPGVRVRFTAQNPEIAARAANAYAELLAERISTLEAQGLAGGVEAGAAVENRAEATSVSAERRPVVHLVLAGLFGLLVSAGAAILLDARTRSWRSARDAEITLYAPVLGTIPDYSVFEVFEVFDGLEDPKDQPREQSGP